MSRERPVTSKELAFFLKVTPRTLANWRAKGTIPYWAINPRNVRYNLADVVRELSSKP
jgi:predicted site-specific integrase-resolvase